MRCVSADSYTWDEVKQNQRPLQLSSKEIHQKWVDQKSSIISLEQQILNHVKNAGNFSIRKYCFSILFSPCSN